MNTSKTQPPAVGQAAHTPFSVKVHTSQATGNSWVEGYDEGGCETGFHTRPGDLTLAECNALANRYNSHAALVAALDNLVRSVERQEYVATACEDARAALAQAKETQS